VAGATEVDGVGCG
jgi:hypothetical protein